MNINTECIVSMLLSAEMMRLNEFFSSVFKTNKNIEVGYIVDLHIYMIIQTIKINVKISWIGLRKSQKLQG